MGVHITSDYSPTTTTQKANSPMSISNNFTTCTRRAAFGFLGASSLVALLTACDDEDKPGARPSTTTSSAAAPETEPPEPADSPSAAPSSSGPKYSGKSKAPAGEFRAADIYGPAQNVPKPTNPPGYTEPTLDGMMKSMKAWTQWRNYGMQTGDYTEAYKFVSKTSSKRLMLTTQMQNCTTTVAGLSAVSSALMISEMTPFIRVTACIPGISSWDGPISLP